MPDEEGVSIRDRISAEKLAELLKRTEAKESDPARAKEPPA